MNANLATSAITASSLTGRNGLLVVAAAVMPRSTGEELTHATKKTLRKKSATTLCPLLLLVKLEYGKQIMIFIANI